jgi:hypothetical protein
VLTHNKGGTAHVAKYRNTNLGRKTIQYGICNS